MSYLFFKIFFVLVSMVRVGRGSSSMSLCRQVIHRRSLDTCKLHHYQQADAVACFDTDQTPDTRRFAFIGDSRIRQHFFSFVQVIRLLCLNDERLYYSLNLTLNRIFFLCCSTPSVKSKENICCIFSQYFLFSLMFS